MDISMSAVIGTIIGILALIAAIYGLRTADKRRKAEALRRAKQAEKEAQVKAARRAKRRAKKIAQIEKTLEQERAERERYAEATRTQKLYADMKPEKTSSANKNDGIDDSNPTQETPEDVGNEKHEESAAEATTSSSVKIEAVETSEEDKNSNSAQVSEPASEGDSIPTEVSPSADEAQSSNTDVASNPVSSPSIDETSVPPKSA